MSIKRLISLKIYEDLDKKMVLLSGPRQCGKTTLARALVQKDQFAYYNWDIDKDRKILRSGKLNPDTPLWIFDELHKQKNWRNWLKGVFDENHSSHSILVTGSARLDAFARGGDSLQGRFFTHRLHPVTLTEFLAKPLIEEWTQLSESIAACKHTKESQEALNLLMDRGGFPEPLMASSKEAKRWRNNYSNQLIREEIPKLQQLRDLDSVELLYDKLSQTVGSVLSINNLREGLEVSFETVKNWILILEKMYGIFRVSPYGPPRIKAVKKEQKLYFWDWARVQEPSARFENLIALHLLRFCHWCEDVDGEKIELRYFRNVVGHEIDFIVLKNRKPWMAVEVKLEDRPANTSFKYLLERLHIPFAFQVSLNGTEDYESKAFGQTKVRILPAAKFLQILP